VTAVIFDHPALGGKIWQAQMLYGTWASVIPETCIYRADLQARKKQAALAGGAIIGGCIFGIIMALVGYVLGSITGVIVGLFLGGPAAGIGALLGWVYAPRLPSNRPRVMLARVPDDNNSRALFPIGRDSHLTDSGNSYAGNIRRVLKALSSQEGAGQEFRPMEFIATTFYNDLMAKDEVAELSAPNDTMRKIQIGAMALMAFGSLGLLLFAVLATGG
jgi:hypothetical protein